MPVLLASVMCEVELHARVTVIYPVHAVTGYSNVESCCLCVCAHLSQIVSCSVNRNWHTNILHGTQDTLRMRVRILKRIDRCYAVNPGKRVHSTTSVKSMPSKDQ